MADSISKFLSSPEGKDRKLLAFIGEAISSIILAFLKGCTGATIFRTLR